MSHWRFLIINNSNSACLQDVFSAHFLLCSHRGKDVLPGSHRKTGGWYGGDTCSSIPPPIVACWALARSFLISKVKKW